MANVPPVCVQTGGTLAINLLVLQHPARWAGLCKSLGLRPEIPEMARLQNALAREIAAQGKTLGIALELRRFGFEKQ